MEDLVINVSEDAIEEQRKQLANKNNINSDKKFVFDEKNYLNTRLGIGETEREITVRLLPVSSTDPNIFLVVKTHNMKVDKSMSKSGYKKFICLNDNNIGEHNDKGCPLCNKSKEFFNKCNSTTDSVEKKSLAKMGYSYQPTDMFIVRVIERGKEHEGVKFWSFNAHSDGTGIYDMLMSIYDTRMKESVEAGMGKYSVFSLENGRDIKIILKYVETTGRTTIKLIEKGFNSKLSNDIAQANAWINDSKTWRDVYSVKPYEYLEIVADGKMPSFDKSRQCFVAKEDSVIDGNRMVTGTVTVSYDDSTTDLPF